MGTEVGHGADLHPRGSGARASCWDPSLHRRGPPPSAPQRHPLAVAELCVLHIPGQGPGLPLVHPLAALRQALQGAAGSPSSSIFFCAAGSPGMYAGSVTASASWSHSARALSGGEGGGRGPLRPGCCPSLPDC